MERYSDKAIEIINELHTERLDYTSEYLPLIDAAQQLEAYEDTGLTPEEVQQMRWIPVEERLPKPQENPVIACDYTGVCLAWYSPTMGWQYRTGLSGVDITHWMPLPQPPKEVSHD